MTRHTRRSRRRRSTNLSSAGNLAPLDDVDRHALANLLPGRRPAARQDEPVLRFSPYAWAKLQYFCHRGDTEIGGFGLAAEDDPLQVIDFLTLKQHTTSVTVAFDDEAVADLFDDQVDAGLPPHRFSRLWLHTHPGHSAQPSPTDEETFARVFGPCDWAVMGIVARGGETWARLRFNVGPGGDVLIPMTVDYTLAFAAADQAGWEAAYQAHVQPQPETLDLDIEVDAAAMARFGGLGIEGDESWWPEEDPEQTDEPQSAPHERHP